MEKEDHIFEEKNFPKDTSTLKSNSLAIKFGASSTIPEELSYLKGISSADSTLTLQEATRSNDQSTSPEVTTIEGTITRISTVTHGLQWKSTLLPSEFTAFMSPSKYSELDPVNKMKKDMEVSIILCQRKKYCT